MSYDAANPTKFTPAECLAAVGQQATLTLTGEIVESRAGPAGPYVMFKPDSHFGFGNYEFGVDLDVLEREEK